jgi:hypothetical protein
MGHMLFQWCWTIKYYIEKKFTYMLLYEQSFIPNKVTNGKVKTLAIYEYIVTSHMLLPYFSI